MPKENTIEEKIYNLMDGFLVEPEPPRSIKSLNKDRHLFVKNILELLKDTRRQALEIIFNDNFNEFIYSNTVEQKRYWKGRMNLIKDLIKSLNKLCQKKI